MADLSTILSWFETGDIPTQNQFQQTFSSFRHKDENIAINNITGLETALNNKLSSGHANDTNAHINVLAKLDASNLNYANTEAWRLALGVGDIPDNVALVDIGEAQEVYNKMQIHAMSMMLADFVTAGKIRAEKIEALGITDLVEATEGSLVSFVANSANYEFQKNDFIAIPVNGNYSLFLFKGGNKAVTSNYLPTGLTNITIAMVEGLQDALSGKIDKPTADGSFFTRKVGSSVTQIPINLSSSYLLFWDGADFKTSSIYRDAAGLKFGIGTTSPSEQLHLTARARMSALVLENNSETLPQQLTYYNRVFYGTNDVGAKRPLMFGDYADYYRMINSLTDAEKTNIKTSMNGGWTTATMSVAIISPPVVDKQNKNYWITLRGANLNLNPASFAVDIMSVDGVTVIANVPGSQVQLYTNGFDLAFYFNFKDIPLGNYKIRLWNGVAYYVTGLTVAVVQNLQILDVSTLTWTKKIYNDLPNPATFGSGGSAIYQSDSAVKAYSTLDPTIVGALKSSKINNVGDNFYLEFSVNYQHGANLTNATQYVGLMNSNVAVDLLDQTLTRIKASGIMGSNVGYRTYYLNNISVGAASAGVVIPSETINVVIIKEGTSMTIAVTARNVTNQVVISAPDIEYSLNMAVNNMGGVCTTSINVTNLYKY